MPEIPARGIATILADIAYDDTDITDRNYRLGHHLNRREPAIKEVGTVGKHLVLPTTTSTPVQERFSILEIVMKVIGTIIATDNRSDDFFRW